MHRALEEYARKWIKEKLAECTDEEKAGFKRIFSHTDPSVEINVIVDGLAKSKLETTMALIDRTLKTHSA